MKSSNNDGGKAATHYNDLEKETSTVRRDRRKDGNAINKDSRSRIFMNENLAKL
jgi:hypothetical protein